MTTSWGYCLRRTRATTTLCLRRGRARVRQESGGRYGQRRQLSRKRRRFFKYQRKRRPKPFPDEAEYRVKDDDDSNGEHESDEADSRARAISAPAPLVLDARPKNRRWTTTTTSSSSSAWTFCQHCRCKSRRPKMRCSVIVTSAGERCRKLYCDGYIEKRYVLQSHPLKHTLD